MTVSAESLAMSARLSLDESTLWVRNFFPILVPLYERSADHRPEADARAESDGKESLEDCGLGLLVGRRGR